MSKVKREASRPVRKRLARKGRLYSEPRPGFVQRWANDQMGNIEELMELGYKPRVKEKNGTVLGKEKEGSSQGTGTFSNAITKVVNRDGLVAILLEIPKEIYDEMRAARAMEIAELEAQLHPETTKDTYGSMSLKTTSGNK